MAEGTREPQHDQSLNNHSKDQNDKNTEIFCQIISVLGGLMKQGRANFCFNYKETAFSLDDSQQVKEALAAYSVSRVQKVIEEMLDITVKLLDNQEQQLLNEAQKEGKKQYTMLQQKITAIKEHLLSPDLKNAYLFYRTCINNVLEQFTAQRLVKPASPQYPGVETVLAKITIKDNMHDNSRQSFFFELYENQLDELIMILSQLKRDHSS
ncbi:hypothetical protein [Desulforamulus hydrothermalis]|uniref:Uncharacterized protein n=1 Tax=Desulforamulus hydrothermalis Lam5 = DSM 18033 TaxID=1121428 RepID=K8E6J3_9FIRM|nr:hypothetical protein [Desulforamulus hydrothermalis]CCO07103.1 conserved hypothetical protein [Desulforamulus hydrothermalis Lam5 = DSM 18033]SHG90104.1 hypothetical protein SAMN02745177_00771 [Desulforamulus hydrothermalis Lam5 = DSM 18033]